MAKRSAGGEQPPSRKRRQRETPLLEGVAGGIDLRARRGGGDEVVSLDAAAEARYLNYALSVITSRALPDVRDGLKPVQRRILYTMWQQRLRADAKPRKCAKVVGDVMGSYHPHGDSAIYDTLVRMAQPFTLRAPLIDGSGNFGSLDGDSAAAMRYTECRLAPISAELLAEIDQETVPFQPNYDGTKQEPVVLPARMPNLLVNGATGIAVGMATNIPPHNLGEVSTALVNLVDDLDLSKEALARYVTGPDFPTGGMLVNSSAELQQIYGTGSGTLRIRATWEPGKALRSSKTINITSVPYGVNKSQLVERIADVVVGRKLPHLLDVKDVSTDDVRIELELKRDADEHKVMSYLFRHTPLQSTFPVNLTCLVPTEQPGIGRPERLDLKAVLMHFLGFRLEVVTRRLEHELAALRKRIHLLEGFALVFDALDEIIALIRRSDGKADAAMRIMGRFPLDAEQTDAILELKIYRLARLEILVIRDELKEKRARAQTIDEQLGDEDRRWTIVRDELVEVQRTYGDPARNPRRTRIAEPDEDEATYSADDLIVDEDAVVLVSRDGWVKRQRDVKDPAATRLREGDALLAAVAGSTRAVMVCFTNFGTAYSCRLIDVPATTGHGEPIQRLFKLKDGERVVSALSLDPRLAPGIADTSDRPEPRTHALAITTDGYSLRFSLAPLAEPSTRAGRKFARPAGTSEVLGVVPMNGDEVLIAATREGRALLCPAREVNFLSGPGKGVRLIRLREEDQVIGFVASAGARDLLTVETSRGAEQTISTAKYEVVGRGGKGRELTLRGGFTRVVPRPVTVPALNGG